MASLKKSPSCHYSNRDIVRAGNSVTQMRSNVRWNERSGNHWRFGQFASCHPTGRLYGVQETWKFRVCSKQSSGNRGSLVWRVLNDWINLKRSETVVLCERQDEKKVTWKCRGSTKRSSCRRHSWRGSRSTSTPAPVSAYWIRSCSLGGVGSCRKRHSGWLPIW